MRNFPALILTGLVGAQAHANICGTDYQNFNPTTNGLDFVTVHSSETLRPCIINMGLFFNYAVNSLTYSKRLNANFPAGQKQKDQTVGADLSAGMGITNRWDFGVNVPFIVSHAVADDHYVSSFANNGATEVKANTKFRLWGDASGGLAAIVSVNNNLIEDNPFTGKDSGPTWNFEIAGDTVIAKKWAAALNLGFRDRNPGTAIAEAPFVPLDDQWIYSIAGSYLIPDWDTKFIFEIFGSRVVHTVDQDTDRNLNSLEGLIGIKHDLSENLALHFGGGKQIDTSIGGPDWRVYAGFNWAIGPVCNKTPAIEPVAQAIADISNETAQPEVFKLEVQFLFERNSDQVDALRLQSYEATLIDLFSTPYDRIVIEGHTDSVGEAAYNVDLSQRRANFVRQILIDKFRVPKDKIEATGLGQTKPIADNGNYQGRQQNRRVEFKIWRAGTTKKKVQ
jgi:outer membrane protein OmpA-like peptidoglycan-associated protein